MQGLPQPPASLQVTQENGQRRWGGPPPGWEGPVPPKRGAEVFIGKLPRDLTEEELLPVLLQIGRVYELRLMIDYSGANRGFAFATYATKEQAREACVRLNNYELRAGKHMGVVMSIDNCRLFVGGIPRDRCREDIQGEMVKLVEGVRDVILYPSATDKTKNRGFAFVEFESHKAAAQARRKLSPGRVQLWGHPICVDWAEPEQEVDDQTMATVKVLYIRNLMLSTTEDSIRAHFDALHPGTVERVKKLKDFAFVHYTERQHALDNLAALNGSLLDGAVLEVQLSKPPDKSIMRYVKSAHKQNPGGQGSGGSMTPDLLAAATQNFLQQQAHLQQGLNLNLGGADPLTWAYTGSPFFQPPSPTAQPTPLMGAGGIAAAAALQQSELVASHSGGHGGRGLGHRGAAGMRSAGFMAQVNKHVRSARSRRSADTTLLSADAGCPYPAAATSAALAGSPTAQPGVLWLPALQAQQLAAVQAALVQQQLIAAAQQAALGKKASDHLVDFCRAAGLGTPEIEVTELPAGELTLYLAKVKLSGLPGESGLGRPGTPFHTAEEAREVAAQLALIQLGSATGLGTIWPPPTSPTLSAQERITDLNLERNQTASCILRVCNVNYL